MNTNETNAMLKTLLEQEERIERLEKMFESLEPITEEDIENLRNAAEVRVAEVLGGYDSNAYKQLGRKAFAACSRDVKRLFTIPRYNELPKVDFEAAMNFVQGWTPDALTQLSIELLNRQNQLNLKDLV